MTHTNKSRIVKTAVLSLAVAAGSVLGLANYASAATTVNTVDELNAAVAKGGEIQLGAGDFGSLDLSGKKDIKLIDADGKGSNFTSIKLNGASNITISGLNFNGKGGNAISLGKTSDTVTITNNTFGAGYNRGVSTDDGNGSANAVVNNLSISSNHFLMAPADNAILVWASGNGVEISGNDAKETIQVRGSEGKLLNNVTVSGNTGTYGDTAPYVFSFVNGLTFDGNTVEQHRTNTSKGQVVYLSSGNQNVTLSNNTFTGEFARGFYFGNELKLGDNNYVPAVASSKVTVSAGNTIKGATVAAVAVKDANTIAKGEKISIAKGNIFENAKGGVDFASDDKDFDVASIVTDHRKDADDPVTRPTDKKDGEEGKTKVTAPNTGVENMAGSFLGIMTAAAVIMFTGFVGVRLANRK